MKTMQKTEKKCQQAKLQPRKKCHKNNSKYETLQNQSPPDHQGESGGVIMLFDNIVKDLKYSSNMSKSDNCGADLLLSLFSDFADPNEFFQINSEAQV